MNKKCRLAWFIFNQSNICCNNKIPLIRCQLQSNGRLGLSRNVLHSFRNLVGTSPLGQVTFEPKARRQPCRQNFDSLRQKIQLGRTLNSLKNLDSTFVSAKKLSSIASKTETFEFAFRSKNWNLNPEWESSSEVAFAQFIQPSWVRIPQPITLLMESSP